MRAFVCSRYGCLISLVLGIEIIVTCQSLMLQILSQRSWQYNRCCKEEPPLLRLCCIRYHYRIFNEGIVFRICNSYDICPRRLTFNHQVFNTPLGKVVTQHGSVSAMRSFSRTASVACFATPSQHEETNHPTASF